MIGVPENTKLCGAAEVAGVVAATAKAVDEELEEAAADDGGSADEGGGDDKEVNKIGGKLEKVALEATAEAAIEDGDEDGLDKDEVNEDIASKDEVDDGMADDGESIVEAALVAIVLEEDELIVDDPILVGLV